MRGFRQWRRTPGAMALGLIPGAVVGLLFGAALVAWGFALPGLVDAWTPFADDWTPAWAGVGARRSRRSFGAALLLVVVSFTAVTLRSRAVLRPHLARHRAQRDRHRPDAETASGEPSATASVSCCGRPRGRAGVGRRSHSARRRTPRLRDRRHADRMAARRRIDLAGARGARTRPPRPARAHLGEPRACHRLRRSRPSSASSSPSAAVAVMPPPWRKHPGAHAALGPAPARAAQHLGARETPHLAPGDGLARRAGTPRTPRADPGPARPAAAADRPTASAPLAPPPAEDRPADPAR